MENKVTLTGITMERGGCDRCGKELGKVFSCSDGRTYGRKCAAIVTGWKPNEIERQNKIAARVAETSGRRAIALAAMPELAASDEILGTVACTDCWWGGRGWSCYPTWQAYAAEMGRRGFLAN